MGEKSKNKSNRKQQQQLQQQQAEEPEKSRQARHLSERQTSNIDNGNNIYQSESFDDDLQNGREAKNPSFETIETNEARSGEQKMENRERHKMEVGGVATKKVHNYGHLNYTLEMKGMLGFDNSELLRRDREEVKQHQQHRHNYHPHRH